MIDIRFDNTQLKSIDMKAIWNNQIIAESDKTIVVERNHYFPADSIKKEFFKIKI